MRSVLGKLLLSTTAVLLFLAGAEVFHRARAERKRQNLLAGRDPKELVTRAAPAPLYYDLKADFPDFTNGAGFRDLPRALTKAPGIFRIAVIGDSVTMQGGLPFEDLYVRQLQGLMDRECPDRVEFLNFGVTGYNTAQEAALLELRALAYAPDLVLWQFHDNDAQPSLHSGGFAEFYDRPTSAFFFYVHGKLDNFWCKQKVRHAARGPLTPDQENLTCRWDEVLGAFARTASRLKTGGVPLVVMLYPTWPRGDDWESYGVAGLDLRRRLAERLRAMGAVVVDLLGTFQLFDPRELRVDPSDPWHPNARGHRLIADAVLPALLGIVREEGACATRSSATPPSSAP